MGAHKLGILKGDVMHFECLPKGFLVMANSLMYFVISFGDGGSTMLLDLFALNMRKWLTQR
jgi:hypothetical protein